MQLFYKLHYIKILIYMKNVFHKLLFLSILFISLPSFAQYSLKKEYNMFRGEDVIVKQQVKFKNPGRAGANVLWDFSKQKSVNEKYKLSYTQVDSDSVITGCEHRTLYHYLLRKDSLFLMGYENPTTLMVNRKAELLLTFPFSYRKRIEGYFYGTGSYCNRLDLTTQGKIVTWGDAYGMIILPNGDTLQHVLRVCSLKKIAEKFLPHVQKDSVSQPVINADSIEHHLNRDSIYLQVETYRWYADGYRYPIFETVESITYKNNKPLKHFDTAFLYTPEKHSYLNDDPENLARLDEVEKADKEARDKSSGGSNNNNNNPHGNNPDNETINYNAYIENGSNKISIEYNLKQTAEVTIGLYDMQGRLLVSYPKTTQPSGFYQEAIALDGFHLGEFLLQIIVNERAYGEKIVKK